MYTLCEPPNVGPLLSHPSTTPQPQPSAPPVEDSPPVHYLPERMEETKSNSQLAYSEGAATILHMQNGEIKLFFVTARVGCIF